jgi:hypothetical protein
MFFSRSFAHKPPRIGLKGTSISVLVLPQLGCSSAQKMSAEEKFRLIF